jgi:hypothetical protein
VLLQRGDGSFPKWELIKSGNGREWLRKQMLCEKWTANTANTHPDYMAFQDPADASVEYPVERYREFNPQRRD